MRASPRLVPHSFVTAPLSGGAPYVAECNDIIEALGMTYAGAQGKTKKQMQAVLHLGDDATVHRGFGELNRALITPRLRCGPPNPLAGLAGALGDEPGHPVDPRGDRRQAPRAMPDGIHAGDVGERAARLVARAVE